MVIHYYSLIPYFIVVDVSNKLLRVKLNKNKKQNIAKVRVS
jgi:hypothetical protein